MENKREIKIKENVKRKENDEVEKKMERGK